MNDNDYTLSSPLSFAAREHGALLVCTIVWHPDLARVGEQWVGGTGAGMLALSRFAPLFRHPGASDDGMALGHGGISRDALRIVRDDADGVEITPPQSRMVVELNGAEITAPVRVGREQIDGGLVIGLGRAVLLCLHWMRCLPKDNPVPGLLGVGHAAVKTRDLIRQVASTDSIVLLLGETGTGKDVAARALHALSRRAALPMVTVNMAALNESLAAADLFGAGRGAYTGAHEARRGLFEQADGATLFLDEVGNTPASVQPMLLRVLESGDYRPLGAQTDRHATARLIAATDQDLYGASFNQPLLRRLESFIIQLPPLRARREDIGVLLVHLLATAAPAGDGASLMPATLVSQFLNYEWPGNIRQLVHVFKRAMLALRMGEMPRFASLVDASPERVTASVAASMASLRASSEALRSGRKKLSELSEQDVLAALHASDWYIQGAAQALGISRPSMYKLIDANTQIRRPDQIASAEIEAALAQCGGDLERCAAQLRTPTEALRRHLRAAGLADL